MLIIEGGLVFYYKTTGILMGNEIIIRPLWETVFTIKAILNFWIVLFTILFLSFFTFFLIKISRKEIHPFISYIMILLMLASIPLFLTKGNGTDKNIVNKIWYCINSCIKERNAYKQIGKDGEIKLLHTEYDKTFINNYKRFFPNRKIIDDKYPLERIDNIDNVLGSYFYKSNKKPNIVIIIVESLGSDVFGQNKHGITFTPFLDSLARHSLVWTNCLSSTHRSFGAIPAITSSVPHGMKGFQFGNIPEHNSLISILKDNNYHTSSFYAGDYSFDKIYDYLIKEDIDFMSPFFQESKGKSPKLVDKSYWGYHDKVMFRRSMEIIKGREKDSLYLDIFTTISQHDNYLKLNDKEEEKYYHNKVDEIISSLPREDQEFMNDIKGFLASTMYGDDAIRYFFNSYNEYYKDRNTIFVISGDHSLNLDSDNPINAFHVPLIIWSPALIKSQRFHSVVSHNNITPSLNTLLRENYEIETPENVHWVSDGLDTAIEFGSKLKTYFLGYTRKKNMCVFEDYFYTEEIKTQAYRIKDSLILEEIEYNDIYDKLKLYQNTMAHIDDYSYSNNKLTKNPINKQNDYSVIETIIIDSVYCSSNKEKPSISFPKPTTIYSTTIDTVCSSIKIIMTADIKYSGDVWQDSFINIGVKFNDHKGQKMEFYDNLAKNITTSTYDPDVWMNIEMIKTYEITKGADLLDFNIYLQPTTKDYLWDPEHTVTLKNIKITFLGAN